MLGNLGCSLRFSQPHGGNLGFSDFYGSDFDRLSLSFNISSRIENC